IYSHGGKLSKIDNPSLMPPAAEIERMEEPTVRAHIHVPSGSIGDMLALIQEKRGVCDHIDTIDDQRVMLACTLPLNEILVDFNDRLKSITRGY
ncbi:elongation factor 4, partial [Klebsiella pneumoniae]